MKTCSVCNNFMGQEEADRVWEKLNNLSIEEFERFCNDAGISENWESAIVCTNCFEYYIY